MKIKMNEILKTSFAKGVAFSIGILTTGLFAAVISGTVTSFNPGGVVSSSLINQNFSSLSTAITGNGTYSTSEVNTEKEWIDGKKIYRKVVDVGVLPNTSSKNVAHGIVNLDTVISESGMADNGAGAYYTLPYGDSTSTYGIGVAATTTDVQITTARDWSTVSGFIVLEYTKN